MRSADALPLKRACLILSPFFCLKKRDNLKNQFSTNCFILKISSFFSMI